MKEKLLQIEKELAQSNKKMEKLISALKKSIKKIK